MSLRQMLLGAVATLGIGAAVLSAGGTARAGGPLPFDGPTPPPNLNVVYLYNQFSSGSSFYEPNGTEVGNTHVQADVPVLRFVHTLPRIDGVQAGVQVIEPYVAYLGGPEVGGADLSHNSGFAEPQLSAFVYPYNNPNEDENLILAYFLSPPSGSYAPTDTLNASTNNWVNNFEVGYTHLLFGKPKGRRLDFQLWYDIYFYGNNGNYVSGGTKFTEHTETANQILLYLPYYFHPQTAGYVGLAFEQTWGGKQYLTTSELPGRTIDTGNRNDFTRIGVIAGSFLSPTVFAEAELQTDVRTRGGVKNDVFFQVQVGKIF